MQSILQFLGCGPSRGYGPNNMNMYFVGFAYWARQVLAPYDLLDWKCTARLELYSYSMLSLLMAFTWSVGFLTISNALAPQCECAPREKPLNWNNPNNVKQAGGKKTKPQQQATHEDGTHPQHNLGPPGNHWNIILLSLWCPSVAFGVYLSMAK